MKSDLVKKPEDCDVLHLVDVECTYPQAQASGCTAPSGYKCPYRHPRSSLPSELVENFSKSENRLSHLPPLRLTMKRS